MDPNKPTTGNPQALNQTALLASRSNKFLTITLSIILLLLAGATAFLAYQNMQLQKQIISLQTAPSPTPTPNTVPNQLTCINKDLGIRLTLPNANWKCDSTEKPGTVWVKLTSPTVTVEMSSLGRGPWCGDSGPDPDCQTTKFTFGNTVSLTLFRYKGVNREIFGGTYFGWISIKWTNMDTTDLSSAQITELTTLLESITQTNSTSTYTCPLSGYVDCMPIAGTAKQKACSADAMAWYKANCPNFKGGAL